MPQKRLWNDPSYPHLDELPLETRQRILRALARMIRHRFVQRKASASGPAERRRGGTGRE